MIELKQRVINYWTHLCRNRGVCPSSENVDRELGKCMTKIFESGEMGNWSEYINEEDITQDIWSELIERGFLKTSSDTINWTYVLPIALYYLGGYKFFHELVKFYRRKKYLVVRNRYDVIYESSYYEDICSFLNVNCTFKDNKYFNCFNEEVVVVAGEFWRGYVKYE